MMWQKETRIFHILAQGPEWKTNYFVQLLVGSVADPWHFGVDTDPDLDPRINASDWWIRILLFSSLAFKMQTKKLIFIKSFSAYYFLKVLLHNFSKIKSQKEITLGDRRIRIWIQKHSDPTDPDPQDWLLEGKATLLLMLWDRVELRQPLGVATLKIF